MTEKHKIALVDDEKTIITTVKIVLEEEGYNVYGFTDSEEALPRLLSGEFDAAVLDIKMPRLDGIEILQRIRKESSMPVIMLTSKDHEIDEVLGLTLGADDYIKKPFSQRLLIARLQSCLRRRAAEIKNSDQDQSDTIKVGNVFLDINRHYCEIAGKAVVLTVTEFLLLQNLLDRPGHVRSRTQLMDAAYGENIHVEDRTIDSHIKRIRRKLKDADPNFNHIETLYGVGYRYQEAGL